MRLHPHPEATFLIRQQEKVRPGRAADPNPAGQGSLHPLPHFSANITPQKGMAKWKHGKFRFPDETRKTTVHDISHFQKSRGRFVGGDLTPIRLQHSFSPA